jgi:hypothetical protein
MEHIIAVHRDGRTGPRRPRVEHGRRDARGFGRRRFSRVLTIRLMHIALLLGYILLHQARGEAHELIRHVTLERRLALVEQLRRLDGLLRTFALMRIELGLMLIARMHLFGASRSRVGKVTSGRVERSRRFSTLEQRGGSSSVAIYQHRCSRSSGRRRVDAGHRTGPASERLFAQVRGGSLALVVASAHIRHRERHERGLLLDECPVLAAALHVRMHVKYGVVLRHGLSGRGSETGGEDVFRPRDEGIVDAVSQRGRRHRQEGGARGAKVEPGREQRDVGLVLMSHLIAKEIQTDQLMRDFFIAIWSRSRKSELTSPSLIIASA